MAFEGLTEKLSATFKKLRGKGRLSEADVKASMKEIRMALLEADVNYKVVKDFIALSLIHISSPPQSSGAGPPPPGGGLRIRPAPAPGWRGPGRG